MFVKLIAGSRVPSALLVTSWVVQLGITADEYLLSTADKLIFLERTVPYDVLLDKTNTDYSSPAVVFEVCEWQWEKKDYWPGNRIENPLK